MTSTLRFADKTALFTGGGTGIGAAVARRIAREGGNVVLIGRRIEPLELVANQTGAMIIAADAADGAAMRAAVGKVRGQFGGVDILIANAGGHGVAPTISMADEQMEYLVAKHRLNSVTDAYALVTKEVPPGRAATADEVANVVCFLAPAEAALVNGAVATVDGGAGTVDLPTLAFVEE